MSPARCLTLAFLPVHSETVGQWLQPRLHPLVPHSLSTPPTPTKTAQVKDTHDPHVAKSYGHLPSVFTQLTIPSLNHIILLVSLLLVFLMDFLQPPRLLLLSLLLSSSSFV